MKRITIVSTPDDGTCGIGTYTGVLRRALDDVSVQFVPIDLRSLNVVHYARAAIKAGTADSDVVHVQHEYGIFGPKSLTSWIFFPLLFLATALTRTPVVLTLHSAWNDTTVDPPLVPLKRLYVALNNKMLALSATHLIFLSENCCERFRDSTSVNSYEVIPHGVQTETLELDRAAAKQEFGYDPDDTVVVEPGYVRPEKGQDVFVEMANHLLEYEFLVAGGTQTDAENEFRDGFERKSPSNVQITGCLGNETFHAAFNAADLIVLPYREVTQSGIFNWCVAYELPVLTSDLDYFQHLREKWGCVATFDTESGDGADRIIELLDDDEKREALISAMGEYKESRTMSSIAGMHRDIYDSLVGGRS